MIRRIVKTSKTEKVKIVFTLKPNHFTGDNENNFEENFEGNFQKLLTEFSCVHLDNFIKKMVWRT